MAMISLLYNLLLIYIQLEDRIDEIINSMIFYCLSYLSHFILIAEKVNQ